MDDYLDGSEPDLSDSHIVDGDPYACDHCGKRYTKSDYGIAASKMLRKHEQRCSNE